MSTYERSFQNSDTILTMDLLRDSAGGFFVRFITNSKILQYEEDLPGFHLPDVYPGTRPDVSNTFPECSSLSTTEKLEDSAKKFTSSEQEQQFAKIMFNITSDGIILVDWYTVDDPANSQNWSFRKKCFVAFQICIYTFSVYIGSAIYTSSVIAVIEIFGVSTIAASLGLAMYVIRYGTGSLLFSSLSEIPGVGRNSFYIITFAVYVVLCVSTALIGNFGGLLVLRFLQGFFGSPCLGTGGATFGDMFNIFQLSFLMAFWTAAVTAESSLGSTIAGYAVAAKDWRWPLWEMLWIAGPIFVLLFICLPKISASNILLRRADRLRKQTGNHNYRSQSEINQKNTKVSGVVMEVLWRPAQIIILDPAITFVIIYTSLVYGVSYNIKNHEPKSLTKIRFTTFSLRLSRWSISGFMVSVLVSWAFPFYRL